MSVLFFVNPVMVEAFIIPGQSLGPRYRYWNLSKFLTQKQVGSCDTGLEEFNTKAEFRNMHKESVKL